MICRPLIPSPASMHEKSASGKSLWLWFGVGIGALVLVGLIWGLLTFLPSSANRLADGTPAPAGSTWVKFTLPDGSASALFPGAVTSTTLPNGVMSHASVVNGTIFALSDKSPMEVSEDFLEKMATPAGSPGLPEDENTMSLETISGNRCLRKTLMKVSVRRNRCRA